jgi:hypothetical protein
MNIFFTKDPDDEFKELDFDSISEEELDNLFEEGLDLFDWDGDALASAGFGTDEDYGGYCD